MSKTDNLQPVRSVQIDTVHYQGIFRVSGSGAQAALAGGRDITVTRTATGSLNVALSPNKEIQHIDVRFIPGANVGDEWVSALPTFYVAGTGSYVTVALVSGSVAVAGARPRVDPTSGVLDVHAIARRTGVR